jgi:hypothetical protein
MKLVLLCALFAPIVYLALRQKKWYLYLLFAFMGVLPEQFSLRLHESLPLLTGTRVLVLIVMGFWLFDKWKTKKFRFPKSLMLFLVVNVIVSLVNLRYGAGEIKRIFLLIFERAFLVVVLMDLIGDRAELHRCIDFAIMGCVALAVIGIVQTVFDYDISSVLHLTKTGSSNGISDRMGMQRAFGTYNAISYGCYCAFMSGLIMYRLYNTKSRWNSAAFAMNLVALLCTFTRSAWLCLAGVFVLVLLVYRMKLIRRLLPALGITLALCVVLCGFQPKLYQGLSQTAISSINTVLGVLPDRLVAAIQPNWNAADLTKPTAETNATEPTEETKPDTHKPFFELDEDFGANAKDPTYSRMAQWSAVTYMLEDGQALFGYGYNALPEGRIHFFFDRWEAKWVSTDFLDVGLVALLMEGGFVGALSFLSLLGYLLVVSLRKRTCFGEMDFYWFMIFMIPLFLLLNFLASFMFASVVWLLIALFYAYRETEPQLPGTQTQENGCTSEQER